MKLKTTIDDEQFRKSASGLLALLFLAVLSGCASQPSAPPVPAPLEQFRLKLDDAFTSHQTDPHRLLSAIGAISTAGDATAEIEKAANLALVALDVPAMFPGHGRRLADLLVQRSLHASGDAVQALGALGASVAGFSEARRNKVATPRVQQAVDASCQNHLAAALAGSNTDRSHDARVRAAFDEHIAAACFAVLSGDEGRAATHLTLAAGRVSQRPQLGMQLAAAGVTEDVSSVTRVLRYRLAGDGYRMQGPLRIHH